MIRKVMLSEIAHARSGDKGNICNVGVIAHHPRFYPVLLRELTPDRVREHFSELCRGSVERYELPNLSALNFVLHEALDGGGTVSLRSDAQGKTYGLALLRLEVSLTEEESREA